ncbi:hypothetical protein FOA43_000090 [Brettanomyces nanus]|uniref:Mitochondrial 15S rRNA processing factor CCM1 n=1 Tax=Eeniella nana TaxID=13502 RepID=A0A875RWF7_EENNA|nr:uncharacterized protein FOA43_000090 [Brettanomyces nanus]QPG72788.1 hypothetical protein FOA43_000090 [Brettanomyces nanus]
MPSLQGFVRRFHSYIPHKVGHRVRNRLNAAVKLSRVPRDVESENERQERRIQEKNARPVTNASAQSLVEKLLGKQLEENTVIGPRTSFTEEELNTIFKQRNLRLKYKVLGTTGNQLKDSLIVDRDVIKYLERDEVTKAVWLARLARYQGIFAYGTILKYLLIHEKFNAALSLFNDIKKRGQRPNGRVLNILFNGFANYGEGDMETVKISGSKVDSLYSIFLRALETSPADVSIVHVNTLLKVFRRAKKPDLAIKLYDNILASKRRELRPDVRTYTEMFSSLRSYTPDFKTAVQKAEELFARLQKDPLVKIDSQLIRSYSSVFVFANDPRLNARAITILREWYRLCTKEDIKKTVNWSKFNKNMLHDGPRKISVDVDVDQEVLLPLSDVNLKKTKRFEPDESIVRRYSKMCKLFGIKDEYKPRYVEVE